MSPLGAASLLSATALLVTTSALLVALLRPVAPGRVLCWWLLAYGQIVLVSEVLSELGLLGRAGYLAGHTTLLLVTLGWWWRGGRPALSAPSDESPGGGIRALCVAVGLLGLANLWLAAGMPPMNGDANAYHLPRAYDWMQLGTARHFPAVDFRLTEFPPDPSFVFAWMMSLSGGFGGLHVPQWTAGLALASGVHGLARLAGASRGVGLFAGALTLTLPAVVLQMGSPQTDLFAAATAAGALLFALRYVSAKEPHSAGRTRPRGRETTDSPRERMRPTSEAVVVGNPRDGSPGKHRADLVLFGVAAGLALGTKLTVLFLVPGAVLAVLLLRPGRRLWPLAGALALGFAAFGAYNAVLNVLDFGHPVASPLARAFSSGEPRPGTNGRLANALRYTYQLLDWPGFPASVARAQHAAFRGVAGALGVDLEAGVWFDPVRESRTVPDEDRSGFGPLGFLALACAPFLLVRATRVERALLVAGLTFPIAFLVYNPGWTAQKVRYLLVALPPILAVALPRLAPSRVLAVSAASLALVVAANVVRIGPSGLRRLPADARPATASAALEEVMGARAREIPALVAPGGTIGVVSSFNDTVFHLFRSLPLHRFVPVAEDGVPALLANGRLDAAIVGEHRDEEAQGSSEDSLLLPRNLLLTRDGPRGLDAHETPDGTWILFPRRTERRPEGGSMRLRVARAALDRLGEDASLLVPLEGVETFEVEGMGARNESSVVSPGPSNGRCEARLALPLLVVEIPRSGGGGGPLYRDVRVRLSGRPVVRGASLLVPRRWMGSGLSVLLGRIAGEALDLLTTSTPLVDVEGFHGIERNDRGPFRWTDGRLVVRLPGVDHASLRLATLGYRGDASVTLTADGEVLRSGIAPGGIIDGTFPLPAGTRTIRLESDVVRPEYDGRALGLCIRELTLRLDKESP